MAPLPSYRSFLGVAKDSINTTSTASVAAAAVTIVVASATGITTSSTIFIWDGPSSESRAVTNVTSNTLTVAALTYAHPANVYISAQTTASVGPTDYIPVTSIDFMDDYGQLADKGLRGSNVDVYGSTQGVASSEFTLGGDVFTDTIGYILGPVLGATDFTGGTPNSHAFSVKNTTTGQPTPYIFYDFDVVETRGYPGAKFSEVQLKFDPAGLLTWTAKGMGYHSGIVTTPTSSFSAVTPMATWIGVCQIGGSAFSALISGEVNIKRSVDVIQNTDSYQGPFAVFTGACSVDGKLMMVMEDNTQLLNYINNSQPALDLTFTNGSGSSTNYVQLHCTKANFLKPKVTQTSKQYVELEVPFEALANTIDATTAGTGFSPIKVTLKSTKATGTYL